MRKAGKRSSQDTRWQETKRIVAERDQRDRIIPILTISEYSALRKNAGQLLDVLDPAHVVPVSVSGEMTYDADNVILLNRYSHDNLDHNRCPVTGRSITRNAKHKWFARIVGVNTYKELLQRAARSRRYGRNDLERKTDQA